MDTIQLWHVQSLPAPQGKEARVLYLAWAPDGKCLAVSTLNDVIFYDENGLLKDTFCIEPIDSKDGYVVKGLAFSPDSRKIAIGQSNRIISVYSIGNDVGNMMAILHCFHQASAVTCLIWPRTNAIIFGLDEGQVCQANTRNNNLYTICDTDSRVVCITSNASRTGILAGLSDGRIMRYFLNSRRPAESQGELVVHPWPPISIAWTSYGIFVTACKKNTIVYGNTGRIVQTFSNTLKTRFMVAAASPIGQTVAISSYNRLQMVNWRPCRQAWEEALTNDIPLMDNITAFAWKPNGSQLFVGGQYGRLELFNFCMWKQTFMNFEFISVGPSQVIAKNLSTGKQMVLKSRYYEINEVKVLDKGRYLLARTVKTIILGELSSGKLSEVDWPKSGNEMFNFKYQNVCIIYKAGNLQLIEYGNNWILYSVPMDCMNLNLISVRINERRQQVSEESKHMAYLLGSKMIIVVNLLDMNKIATINHNSIITWLELNETGHELLFLDKKMKLHIYNLRSGINTTILSNCPFARWVPGSDVVVAQNQDNICVWYDINAPGQVTKFPSKGKILYLKRGENKTEVIAAEGMGTISYVLDNLHIDFGTAIRDGNYLRGMNILNEQEISSHTRQMWKKLSRISLEAKQLHIAKRSFAALGDMYRVQLLQEMIEIADRNAENYREEVRTRLATLIENIFLEDRRDSNYVRFPPIRTFLNAATLPDRS